MEAKLSPEQIYNSKIATENGLVSIGLALAEKNQKEKDSKLLLAKLQHQISKDQNHPLAHLVLEYIAHTDTQQTQQKNKIKQLDEEFQLITEESDDLLEQLEASENREKVLLEYQKILYRHIQRREKIIYLGFVLLFYLTVFYKLVIPIYCVYKCDM